MLSNNDSLVCVSGRVENILFQNEESGYVICDVLSDDEELITVTGNIPYVSVGERLELKGKWVQHKTYGRQFSIENFEKILPTEENDILRYLSSGSIKGIGPKTAQKIVEKYGKDSFDVIAKFPHWLSEIKGISLTKAKEISKDFNEKAGVREIIMFCKEVFSPTIAIKIYNKFGTDGVSIIKTNPYLLSRRIQGISFKLVDQIALENGIEKEDENRIKSALIYVLRIFASRDGHTYATKHRLIESTSKLIEVDEHKILPYVDVLATEDVVKIVDFKNETHVYLKENYDSEEYIAEKLLILKNTVFSVDYKDIKSLISFMETRNGIEYAKMQKRAIEEALLNGVTIITGGPGTGKTTIVKALIQIFEKMGLRCGLCAPTGRAAQRMSEATSHEATTIHKILDAMPATEFETGPIFERNEKNLLDREVIIVDESSMLDIHLAEALLRAMKPGSRLILIGDTHQLPSVSEGDVLNDAIASECFPVVKLNEVFRQAENSGIVMNAHKINNGEMPDPSKKYDDFFFIPIKSEESIPNYICDLCNNRLPKKYGVDPIYDIQVITPTKLGPNGTRNLNAVLQEKLNPKSSDKNERYVSLTKLYREGDKVMQTRNNYEYLWLKDNNEGKGIFNGDVGVVKSVDNENRVIMIDFYGKLVKFDTASFDELEHAYAVTVHKSQGSEYPIVIIPMTKSAPMLLTRNLIYTAVTRASRMVILLGDREVFNYMIENDRQIVRNTGLSNFLRSQANYENS